MKRKRRKLYGNTKKQNANWKRIQVYTECRMYAAAAGLGRSGKENEKTNEKTNGRKGKSVSYYAGNIAGDISEITSTSTAKNLIGGADFLTLYIGSMGEVHRRAEDGAAQAVF